MELDQEKQNQEAAERCRALAQRVVRELAPRSVQVLEDSGLLEKAFCKMNTAVVQSAPELLVVADPQWVTLPAVQAEKVLLVCADSAVLAGCAQQLAQQGAAYAVVTLKDSAGNILYPSQVAAAAGSIEGASLDPALIASVLKENGLVPVAKLAAFRDPIAARTDRNMAIGYTGQAYLWLDNKASAGGNPWLNPYSDEAVQFIGDLIGEVQSMGFDHVLLENVQFPSAQNGKQDFGSTGGRDRSAQLAADIAAWDARFEGSVTLWYGYSLGQVTDGASTVGGSATALGVRNLVVEVPAKQTMDDTARNELRDTLSASGVEHAVFWDDAAGIFQ